MHSRYGDHRDVMRDICGPEVASSVGETWRVGEGGQLKRAWGFFFCKRDLGTKDCGLGSVNIVPVESEGTC